VRVEAGGVDTAGEDEYAGGVSAKGRGRKPRLKRAAALLAALSLGSCSSPSPPRETPPAAIVLAGAEHLTRLLRAEVLAFRDRYPEAAEITITPEGSAEGMERLVNGEVAMSVLTRDLTDPEVHAAVQRDGLGAFAVAWDAVAVIVNPRTPVEQVSRTELGQIYRGEIGDWGELGWRAGGRIAPLTTVPKLGLYEFLQQTLLGGDPYGPGVYAQESEQAIVDIVASRTDAIGCVSRGLVDDRVRTLKVSAAIGLPYIALDRESLVLRTYPLMRSISLCARSKPSATASDFITFVASAEGQQIVARHGYAPATVPVHIVRTIEEEE
jgi:phosphate transport system substrate-binding protein